MVSCNDGDDESEGRTAVTFDDDSSGDMDDDSPHDDDSMDDDSLDDDSLNDDADDDNDDDDSEGYDDWDESWQCDLWDGCECALYYREFLEKVSEYSRPICEDELWRQIDDVLSGNVLQLDDPIPENELQEKLIDLLNIGFLLEDMDENPLESTVLEDEIDEKYRYRYLEFSDEWIGEFQGILLTPKTGGSHPVVVAVHGHTDNANSFMSNYYGSLYPENGYAILMVTVRARCADRSEHVATRKLLLDGFSLIGLRVYMALQSADFLRGLDEIDPDAIFLIGHSAGSIDGNITRIIGGSDYFLAYVSDETSQSYCNLGMNDSFMDGVAPAISPYSFLVSPVMEYSVSVMQQPYGYPDGIGNVIDFFNSKLLDKL